MLSCKSSFKLRPSRHAFMYCLHLHNSLFCSFILLLIVDLCHDGFLIIPYLCLFPGVDECVLVFSCSTLCVCPAFRNHFSSSCSSMTVIPTVCSSCILPLVSFTCDSDPACPRFVFVVQTNCLNLTLLSSWV